MQEFETAVKRWVAGEAKPEEIPQEVILYNNGELEKTPLLDIPHILLECLLIIKAAEASREMMRQKNRELEEQWERMKAHQQRGMN